MTTIYIGSDHRGFHIKEDIINFLRKDHKIVDCGTYERKRTNYNDYANKVCESVLKDEHSFGILICGTGIGMSIMANRHKGIRCALCTTLYTVNQARHHNNANVLAIGANTVEDDVVKMVKHFVRSKYVSDNTYDLRNQLLDV